MTAGAVAGVDIRTDAGQDTPKATQNALSTLK